MSENDDRTRDVEIGILGSGSRGNAALVRSNGAAFLVDAGLSARQITKRLETYGVRPQDLMAIVLTHEHIDHIRSAGTLARKWNLPLWTNKATYTASQKTIGKTPEWMEIEVGLPFHIGGIRVEPFSTPHDAADPFGLICNDEDGRRVGFATDMGFVTNLARQRLQGLQGLVLEFNHDVEMLINGPYPWPIKQRIRGKLGHLSNEDAAKLLKNIVTADFEWLICAHISQENNENRLLLETARKALKGHERRNLLSASQDEPTPLVGAGGITEGLP